MEHKKYWTYWMKLMILNLWQKNWIFDQSNANYDIGNQIFYNTEVLKSNLCDCKDIYILVRGDITVTAAPETQVSFKSCAPFT